LRPEQRPLISQLTPRLLAGITGGTWVNAPPDDWRPRGVCFRVAGPHALVFADDPAFPGVDVSRTDPLALQGCALVVNESFQDSRPLPQLKVRSVYEAAAAIAPEIRERYSGTICAVTGSVGKSSTSTLLRHALRRFGSCADTRGHGNILRGIIRQTMRLRDEKFAVIEVSGPSNVAKSSCILRPHVAIVTGLAPAHLQTAGTMDELAARKAGIFAGLEPGGTAIVNRGTSHYETLSGFAKKHAQNFVSYGDHEEADVRLLHYDWERQLVRAHVHGEVIEYPLALLGRHMAVNSLAALAALHALGLDWRKGAFEFGYAETPRGRGDRHRLRIAEKSVLLIDDAYNANPASMVAGIELLAETQPRRGGKRIAVLGDMLELGDDEARFHAELAGPIVKAGIERVYATGLLMTHLWDALPAHLRGRKVETAEALIPVLQSEIGDGDVILFKGSHGSKLYKAVEDLRRLNERSPRAPATGGGSPARPKTIMQRLLRRVRDTVQRRTYTLTFCGDTSLGDYFLKRYKRFLDRDEEGRAFQRRLREAPLSFFENVRPLISGSNCLIANLETTLPSRIRSPLRGRKKHVIWDNPRRTPAVLKDIGIDALNLANNHANDFGGDGLLQTMEVLKASGFSTFGAGGTRRSAAKPFVRTVRCAGRKKALIVLSAYELTRDYKERYDYYAGAASPGVNPLNSRVGARIERLRAQDPQALIVACPHWLQNYRWANEKEIDIASALIDAGADIVIGTGAHTMGQCRWSKSGTVILSIGDFIFNWRGFYRSHSAPPFSLIARLDIAPRFGRWSSALKLYPIVTDNLRTGFQVQPVDQAMLASVYALLAERAPDEAAFCKHFEQGEDARGLHIALNRPISPRFV